MSQITDAICVAVQANVPVLLEGIPGDAKTSIVSALLRQLTVDHEVLVLAFREPAEVGGYPTETPQGMALLPTQWAYRLRERSAAGDQLVGIFLDELTSAPPAVRAAALRGVAENVFGECEIKNLRKVAAQNPPHLAESGYQLSAAMANRFMHLEWSMPIRDWAEALLSGFQEPKACMLPAEWEKHFLPAAHSKIAAFAQRVPDAIRNVPKDMSKAGKAWPSLRTWTYAARVLAACESIGHGLLQPVEHSAKAELPMMMLCGCVGEGSAREFLTWVKDLDLPDPELVLREPTRELPTRQDLLYAMVSSVAAAVLSNNTLERWNQAWKFYGYMAEQQKADIASIGARLLINNKPTPDAVSPAYGIGAFSAIIRAAGLDRKNA